jgi:hypothetical protein
LSLFWLAPRREGVGWELVPARRQTRAADIGKEKFMAIKNQFLQVAIGTPVDAHGRFKIRDNVLKSGKITWRKPTDHSEMTMRGLSDALHTTHMNQASVGAAGAYGVEGVQKVTSAVAAYFGYSQADLAERLSVVYEIVQLGGHEFIQFNNLTPLKMLSALNDSPKEKAEKALDLYNEFIAKIDEIEGHPYVKALGWSIPQVFDMFPKIPIYPQLDPKKIEAKYQRLKSLAEAVEAARSFKDNWTQAADGFRKSFGEGIVVGVLWGGIGQATMTVSKEAEASVWKYGGNSKFSYAGNLTSVAVEATYDASRSADRKKIQVECTSDSSGKCVSAQVKSWTDKLHGKAFDAVADFKPLAAAAIKPEASVPEVSDFVAPTAVTKETERLTKKKVETAAKLATYDKVAKSNPAEKSVDKFLNQAEKSPDTGPMTKLKAEVASNSLSTLSLLEGT